MKRKYLFLIIVIPIYYWTISEGSWNLFIPKHLGEIYDSMGEHFLKLSTDVDPDALEWEAFSHSGKTTTYFGPLPSIVRIIGNAVFKSKRGMWAGLCFMTLSLFCLIIYAKLLNLNLDKYSNNSNGLKTYILNLVGLSLALGTPLYFLVSSTLIFHEPYIWALTGSVLALYFYFKIFILEQDSWLSRILLTTAVGATLLSRVTFGMPWYLILIMAHLFSTKARRFSFIQILPAFLALLLTGIINYSRFHNPFLFMDVNYLPHLPESHMAVLQNFGSYNIRRFPDNFLTYFVIYEDSFSTYFPYIFHNIPVLEHLELFTTVEPTTSFTLCASWLLFLAALGLIETGKRRSPFELSLLTGLFIQFVAILFFCAPLKRYQMEFMPFLLAAVAMAFTSQNLFKRGNLILSSGLALFSIYATLVTTIAWVANDFNTHPLHKEHIKAIYDIFHPPQKTH